MTPQQSCEVSKTLNETVEEAKLASMDLAVCAALLMDILSDYFLISILAHGIYVESARPELPAPEHLLDFGMGAEDLLCGDTLDRLGLFVRPRGRGKSRAAP